MTPLELEKALRTLYGEHWATKAPPALGVHRTTLYRQVTCQRPMTPLLVVAVTALLELEHIRARRREIQAGWRARKKGGDQ